MLFAESVSEGEYLSVHEAQTSDRPFAQRGWGWLGWTWY